MVTSTIRLCQFSQKGDHPHRGEVFATQRQYRAPRAADRESHKDYSKNAPLFHMTGLAECLSLPSQAPAALAGVATLPAKSGPGNEGGELLRLAAQASCAETASALV